MSGIMKSSLFFTKKVGSYSDGWGEVTGEAGATHEFIC